MKLSHLILFQNQSQKKGSACCLRKSGNLSESDQSEFLILLPLRVRYSLKFDEILYLEKQGASGDHPHKENEISVNMNLNEIWEKLDERMFAAVHGSLSLI